MVRRSPGFTLLEATIVLSMMLALLVLVAMYFVRGQRYATDTEAYASVQRNSTLILRRVTSDLFKSTMKNLDTSPSEDAIWFLSSDPAGAGQSYMEFNSKTGRIVWRKWVCYYLDSSKGEIIRAELPLAPPDSELLVAPTPSASLSVFQTSAGVVRQPVGRQVKSFRVSRTSKGVVVSLTTRGEAALTNSTAQDRLIEVNIASQVTLIN